jgi:hypothetical protein
MGNVVLYVICEETNGFPFYEFVVKCSPYSFMTFHPSNFSLIILVFLC